jgi:hypothetical protein
VNLIQIKGGPVTSRTATPIPETLMLTVTDRDLLVIDPSLFIGAAAAAATVIATIGDGTIAGTELQSSGADFEVSDIGFGHVAVINDAAAVEVVSRTDAATLEVSKPRATSLDAKIPPGDVSEATVNIVTFVRLIEQTRAWTLGALGIEDESIITDPSPVSLLVALRTAARALAHAAAMDPADASLAQRASLASALASQAGHRTLVPLDLNGDGRPDATRAAHVLTLTRM